MSFLSSLALLLRPAPPVQPEVSSALRRIAGQVERSLSAEPGFERALAPGVRNAIDYCDSLVAQLPQTLSVERSAFASEPHVNALFGCADDIDAMMGQSPALIEHLSHQMGAGNDYCYALLAARRHEKQTWGIERSGEIIRNDVPQRLLHFSHHNLSLVADDPAQARNKLTQAAFDSLIMAFANHVQTLRNQQNQLRQERALTSTRQRLQQQSRHDPLDESRFSRTIALLDQHLTQNADALLPGRQIAALAELLSQPEAVLRLEPVSLHVDRVGKLVSSPSLDNGVSKLELTELISRDRRRHVVMPVRFRRSTVIEALERTRRERARFIVI